MVRNGRKTRLTLFGSYYSSLFLRLLHSAFFFIFFSPLFFKLHSSLLFSPYSSLLLSFHFSLFFHSHSSFFLSFYPSLFFNSCFSFFFGPQDSSFLFFLPSLFLLCPKYGLLPQLFLLSSFPFFFFRPNVDLALLLRTGRLYFNIFWMDNLECCFFLNKIWNTPETAKLSSSKDIFFILYLSIWGCTLSIFSKRGSIASKISSNYCSLRSAP